MVTGLSHGLAEAVAGASRAAFAAGLKDAVELDAVCDDLTRAVHQALEPACVSLWISTPAGQ